MLVSEDVYNKTPEKTNTWNHNEQVTMIFQDNDFFYLYYFSININHTFLSSTYSCGRCMHFNADTYELCFKNSVFLTISNS